MRQLAVAVILVVSSLFFGQGCTTLAKSDTANNRANQGEIAQSEGNHGNHQDMPSHQQDHAPADTDHNPHNSASTSFKAQLTVAQTIGINKPVTLAIDIQDAAGKPQANFETFQEKLMHLIAVSDDLEVFDHLHPEYKGNGRFEVTATFPKPGNYTMFADYKPAGNREEISVLKTSVSGPVARLASDQSAAPSKKVFGNTEVNLDLGAAPIKSGANVMLQFNLRDTATSQGVNLQPYLGELGHLVIVKASPDLTAADYIHAHAHTMGNTPAGEVHFMTHFPQPGKYKMWGQFNRDGKIITADFWVNVVE
ncbi:MAG TPA: hypothetical protein IGS52_12315 [Oscillatoriaceae cyanobacterium M33_DOE_052]|uniref:YtkA-like domain-containing protein n=1 Tax=Planktothricoides sp. SpSt-374 TaxID=2282167 RepID=A0A7C3ZMY7_9CYAN|nr:hypothetical protein [Oscillatoriaceae cyanobacterium M33_DOE_052]